MINIVVYLFLPLIITPCGTALAQTCSPALLGSHNTPGCRACHVYVSGNTAYVADGNSGLQIINVSNPASPTLLGSYDLAYTGDVYVSGSMAYVADVGSGLQIINVSDPASPTFLGSYDTPGDAIGVYVSGSTAYVADGYSGLHIIDVSNPANPTLLGGYGTPSYAIGVYVSGSTAYVADSWSGLQIIDVSNPRLPVPLGSYDTLDRAMGVYVSDSTAYVADGDSGLQIIDVSDPSSPSLLGSYDTPDRAMGVYVSNNVAYVTDRSSGLRIIDVSNPANPTLLGSYDTPNRALGVYVSGDVAYVGDGDSGLQIIDVSSCGVVELCANGIDDDGDGLIDCADPECCDDPICFDTQICDVITENLLSKEAVLNNVNMEVVGIQNFACTFNSASLELVRIDSGAFAGKGFFKGSCQITCEGVSYTGEWKGVLFRKPPESEDRKFYLKGAITGGIEATVEGYLSESVPGSENYDKYQAAWQVGRLGGAVASFTLNVNGSLSYGGETPYNGTHLLLVRDNIETTDKGNYKDVGGLSIVLTHLRVVSADNPYVGEGFSIMSYNSQSGAGQGWTYDRLLTQGIARMEGLFSSPLFGIASATLDDSTLPRTLSLNIKRIDLGVPPMADLEVRTWGPERVSPGQTVDYVVEYRNDGVMNADDVVVVLQLPPEVEYISSTNEGIYRWEAHEVFWKLGTLPPQGLPGSRGILSVKVKVKWGLLLGTQLRNVAITDTTSDEKDKSLAGFSLIDDILKYLDYQALEIASHERLSAEEFADELADPDFADVFSYAIELGYEYSNVSGRLTYSDSSQLIYSIMGSNEKLVLVTKIKKSNLPSASLIVEPNNSEQSVSFFDREGGIKINIKTGEILSLLGESLLDEGSLGERGWFDKRIACLNNCGINAIPHLGNILTFNDCRRFFGGNNEAFMGCIEGAIAWGVGIGVSAVATPLVGIAAGAGTTMIFCLAECAFNPDLHTCEPGTKRRYCACIGWDPSITCDVMESTCGDNYGWPLPSMDKAVKPCEFGRNCIGPRYFDKPGADSKADCAPCDLPASRLGFSPRVESKATCEPPNSGSGGSGVVPASDPNIKYGPSGAVVAGQTLDYRVEFENEGEGIAFGVYFTDTLDEDLDESTRVIGPVRDVDTNAEIGPAGTYDPNTRTITWFVGNGGEVGSKEGGYADLSVNVKSGAANGTEIINYGTVYFPSVPEETRTNAIVSRIPLIEDCSDEIDNDEDGLIDCEDPDCFGQDCTEVCDDEVDNDGDGFVDCADTDCPPCPEICDNGLDDDRDGFIDCDDPDCAGIPPCCTDTNYSKGTSSITFKGGNKDRASLKMCVNRTFCDALRTGPKDIIVQLDGCNQITVPGNKIRADRTKTVFSASSSTYTLKIDCRSGTLTLTLRNLALKDCVSNPVKTCISIKDGPCLCAEKQFVEKRDRKGNLVKLSLTVKTVCTP